MQIEVQAEDKDGNLVFNGVLKEKELNFVINVGMNYLLAKGAIPFMTDGIDDEDSIPMPSTDTKQ